MFLTFAEFHRLKVCVRVVIIHGLQMTLVELMVDFSTLMLSTFEDVAFIIFPM